MSLYNGINDNYSAEVSNNESEFYVPAVAPDYTSIEGLPGFDRIPAVHVERLKISPYLLGKKLRNVSNSVADLNKLTAECYVSITRRDLEALRDEICKEKNSEFKTDSKTTKCRICGKVYFSEKRLQNHLEKKHMIVYKHLNRSQKRVSFSDKVIVHELQEYHKCRKCTRIFETYKLLKKHMKLKHKKSKCYICHYCSKNFVDRMFFKVHIKLHCEVCGLLLESKTKCTEHMRTVCQVPKYYKCRKCNSKFFKLMDLKEHSYEHTNICYVCDICKSQFDTKCALAHHTSYLHTENRPTELYSKHNLGSGCMYVCNFCNESSEDRYTLEMHVENLPDLTNEAITGYNDYYFCDQCMERFDTETTLIQHKWTHFLKNSDNQQERNRGILTKKQPIYKYVYKMTEELPQLLQPRIVLENLRLDVPEEKEPESIAFVDVQCIEVDVNTITNAATKTKPSILSKSNSQNAKKSPSPIKYFFSMDRQIKPVDQPLLTNLLQKSSVLPKPPERNEIGDNIICNGSIKKPIVDPISKKTLLSRHQCEICHKYLCSNSNLTRHMATVHPMDANLQCDICEETFVWKSLLKSHRCIRLNLPEMPFDDARPEIHFDNISDLQNGDLDMNYQYVDFEIPEPVVEICEDDAVVSFGEVSSAGYSVVMQEVPIEF